MKLPYEPKLGLRVECKSKWFLDDKIHFGKIIHISPNKHRLMIASESYPKRFSISTKETKIAEGPK